MNEQLGPSLPQELPFALGAITSFEWQNESQPVRFVRRDQIAKGVECDAYDFINDPDKDLGIIRIQPGHKTPLQKVQDGKRTVEGYLRGKGKLKITRANTDTDNKSKIFEVGDISEDKFEIQVYIGDLMQWEAAPDSLLTVYEICFPRYKEGRYKNIEQSDSINHS